MSACFIALDTIWAKDKECILAVVYRALNRLRLFYTPGYFGPSLLYPVLQFDGMVNSTRRSVRAVGARTPVSITY